MTITAIITIDCFSKKLQGIIDELNLEVLKNLEIANKAIKDKAIEEVASSSAETMSEKNVSIVSIV